MDDGLEPGEEPLLSEAEPFSVLTKQVYERGTAVRNGFKDHADQLRDQHTRAKISRDQHRLPPRPPKRESQPLSSPFVLPRSLVNGTHDVAEAPPAYLAQLPSPQPPPVLGKRTREPSPDLVISDELFEEINKVNSLFYLSCLDLIAPPATFELRVAGHRNFRVGLVFSAGYPKESPQVISATQNDDCAMSLLTQGVLDGIFDGKPCLVRLMRALVEAVGDELGQVPWRYNPRTFSGSDLVASTPVPRYMFFPNMSELEETMHRIQTDRFGYPPKIPVFEKKDGYNTAFYSESYARELFKTKKIVVEGNERLEFLGDSAINTLITVSLMNKYQLNEGGMTKLRSVLRSNALFSVISRTYGLPSKLLVPKSYTAKQPSMAFKAEADVFEAMIGGLYEDGCGEPGGWIILQKWAEELIEPWIDWLLSRLEPHVRESFQTFNHIKLDEGHDETIITTTATTTKPSSLPSSHPPSLEQSLERRILNPKGYRRPLNRKNTRNSVSSNASVHFRNSVCTKKARFP